jgi:hypothetical protein
MIDLLLATHDAWMKHRASHAVPLACLIALSACSSDRRLGGAYAKDMGTAGRLGTSAGGSLGAAAAGGFDSATGGAASSAAGTAVAEGGARSVGGEAAIEGDSHPGGQLRIAVDRDDNAVWCWVQSPETGPSGTTRVLVSHWSSGSEAWSPAQALWESEGDVRVVLGPVSLRDGTAQVLYATEDPERVDAERYRIWLGSSNLVTGLGASLLLGVAGRGWWQEPTTPRLEMQQATNGLTLVAWGDPSNGGRHRRITQFYDAYDPVRGWQQRATDTAEEEWVWDVNTDDSGRGIVLWPVGDDVLYREYVPSSGWSVSQPLLSDLGSISSAKVARGHDGEIWVTAPSSSLGGEASRRFQPATGWGKETPLGLGGSVYALVAGGRGAVAVIGSECAVSASTFDPQLGWSPAIDLPANTGLIQALAVNDAGDAWVLGTPGVKDGLACITENRTFAHSLVAGVSIDLGPIFAAAIAVASGGDALIAWQKEGTVHARWLSAAP